MSHEPRVTSRAKRHLIACEVFRDEFEAVCPPEMARTYLEQGLHRTPGKMPEAIQGVIDGLPTDTQLVLLGYGLCSNGVVGVTARLAPIIMPMVHDCIAVLLGSVKRYEAEMEACAGSLHLAGLGEVRHDLALCLQGQVSPKVPEKKTPATSWRSASSTTRASPLLTTAPETSSWGGPTPRSSPRPSASATRRSPATSTTSAAWCSRPVGRR